MKKQYSKPEAVVTCLGSKTSIMYPVSNTPSNPNPAPKHEM